MLTDLEFLNRNVGAFVLIFSFTIEFFADTEIQSPI